MPNCNNGQVSLYYETFGDVSYPTLVLVNGLSSQCISYSEEFCGLFVGQGFHVIRFDNRDVGLSSDGPEGYSLSDMGNDVLAILDDLDIASAHLFGMSLGGMIVQTVAIDSPHRVRSLISVMSTTGDRDVGQASAQAVALLMTPGSTQREEAVANHLAGLRVWGSPEHFDEMAITEFAHRMYERACRPQGVVRQFRALRRDGSRSERLSKINVPTLVIHGTSDTLIDISGGRRTAEVIGGAQFQAVKGMGHDCPPYFWEEIVRVVTAHAKKSDKV